MALDGTLRPPSTVRDASTLPVDSGSAGAGDAGAPGPDGGMVPLAVGAPADQIKVPDVDADQGAVVQVVQTGLPLPPGSRSGPLFQGRPMLLRGFWGFVATWSPRPIRAQLNLLYGDGRRRTLNDTKMVARPSDGSSPDGTFQWQLAADDVQSGMEFSIELYEANPSPGAPLTPPSRLPTSGAIPMGLSN